MVSIFDDSKLGNTKAPTVDKAAFFMLLASNKKLRGTIWSVDIPSAFLTAPLDADPTAPKIADTYMIIDCKTAELLLKEYPKWSEFLQLNGTMIFKICMSIYGLKQSPRNWFLHLCSVLWKSDMKQCTSDRCMWYYEKGKKRVYVCFWVDDLFLLGNCQIQMLKIIETLESQFGKLEVMKDSFLFLGMQISVQPDFSIVVDNAAYVRKILTARWNEEIGEEFRRKRGPLSPSSEDLFLLPFSNDTFPPKAVEEFQAKIGELNFALSIRIDIVKEVTFLSTRSHHPCAAADRVYRQIIAYLYEYPTRPVRFGSEDLTLHVYPDASYASHRDGYSHSGMFITLGPNGGPIYVKSKKQKLLARSSSEAEIIAAASICDEALFLAKLEAEMLLVEKVHFVVMEDNTSSISILENGEGVGGKAKHFLVRYQFVTDLKNRGILTLKHCPTLDMIADYLTKGMIGAELSRQIVRAMYQGDLEGQDAAGRSTQIRAISPV